MTRSTKKPIFTDQQHSRAGVKAKRQANRKVRAKLKKSTTDPSESLDKGKSYRKVSESWDIRDFSFYAPKDPKARRK